MTQHTWTSCQLIFFTETTYTFDDVHPIKNQANLHANSIQLKFNLPQFDLSWVKLADIVLGLP